MQTLGNLINNEADMSLSAMTITDERKEILDFSIPYTTAQQFIIVLADNDKVTVFEDLAGMNIGVHLGITGDFLAQDIRLALFHLGEITGTIVADDLLANIFGKFCIGK